MRRAVVIGGGVGGLVCARVLADRFDEVEVLERGRYPESPAPRKHVPQGQQVHVLLAQGYRLFQEWFPDFGERMDALGIHEVDFAADSVQFLGAARMPRDPADIAMRCASRPILEWTLQRAVAERPEVTFSEATKVTEWILDDDVVNGVRVSTPDGERDVAADLVVDTSGRATMTPRWLAEHGFGEVEETKIDAGFAYATGRFRPASPERLGGVGLIVCNAQAPDWPVLGVMIALPDGTVHGCQIGAPGHHPALEPAAFLEGFKRCGGGVLYDALHDAEVVEPPAPYRFTANRWNHYERLARWPGRFVAVGDTACALNPRFGQGMTVAAIGADALGKWIDQRTLARLDADPNGFAKGFQRRLCRELRVPWLIATSDDRNFMPAAPLGIKDRAASWYFEQLMAIATRDAPTYITLMRVAQLLDPPRRLFGPGIVARVLRQGLLGAPRTALAAGAQAAK